MTILKKILATVVTITTIVSSYQLSAMNTSSSSSSSDEHENETFYDSLDEAKSRALAGGFTLAPIYLSQIPFPLKEGKQPGSSRPELNDIKTFSEDNDNQPSIDALSVDLRFSCLKGNINNVKSILRNTPYSAYSLITKKECVGDNALHNAILGANLKIVKLLINTVKQDGKDRDLLSIEIEDLDGQSHSVLDYAKEMLSSAKKNNKPDRVESLTNIINFLSNCI